MIANLFKRYLKTPLITRLIFAFLLGSCFGLLSWYLEIHAAFPIKEILKQYISPFGTVFINMLKMVVVPIVFFSLLQGASQLPISKLGKVGGKLMLLYLGSSFLAAGVGIFFALIMDPGKGTGAEWHHMVDVVDAKQLESKSHEVSQNIIDVVLNMFANPFDALANSNFLALIVFSIMLGLGFSAASENSQSKSIEKGLQHVAEILDALNATLYKLVTWIMEYAPVGVLALTIVNFGLYGPAIVGPYLKVVAGIILAIAFMILIVYSLLIKSFVKRAPGFS